MSSRKNQNGGTSERCQRGFRLASHSGGFVLIDSSILEERHYRYALEALFWHLRRSAYVFAARWSQLESARNPLLFSPGAVGLMGQRQIARVESHFNKDDLRNALREFSFTKLLVANDREIWFHFRRPAPEEHPTLDEQVYLRPLETDFKKAHMILVEAERASEHLVDQIIKVFDSTDEANGAPATYEGKPLSSKRDAIKTTLDLGIFSVFDDPDCGIENIYFIPAVFPSGSKKIAGIFSFYMYERMNALDELLPVFQPFVQGIMAPYHLAEVEEQRRTFSMRSAIAAIMSRNISHNIGSHVLWHLSQELRSEFKAE